MPPFICVIYQKLACNSHTAHSVVSDFLLKIHVFTSKDITNGGFNWKLSNELRKTELFTNITSTPHTPSLSQSLDYIPATTRQHALLQSS